MWIRHDKNIIVHKQIVEKKKQYIFVCMITLVDYSRLHEEMIECTLRLSSRE